MALQETTTQRCYNKDRDGHVFSDVFRITIELLLFCMFNGLRNSCSY